MSHLEKRFVWYRGSRKSRQRVYLNLRRKSPQVQKNGDGISGVISGSLTGSLQNLQLPINWHPITDRHDQISFIRHENWEFCGQRGITELNPGEISLVSKAHGSSVDLKGYLGETCESCQQAP